LVHREVPAFSPALIHNEEVVAEVNRLTLKRAEASGS
jgi:energy-coupling factor transport system ATP-binding protein